MKEHIPSWLLHLLLITFLFIINSCKKDEVERHAPVANAGSDTTVLVGKHFFLDGSGSSDADGNELSYAWSIKSKPETSSAVISKADCAIADFTPDKTGEYVFLLTVSDKMFDPVSDEVIVSVSSIPNNSPIANAGVDQTVLPGTEVTLDGSKSLDRDKDPLIYSWSFIAKPEGSMATITDSDKIVAKFVADKEGTYLLQLSVNDGKSPQVTDQITVTVRAAQSTTIFPSNGHTNDLLFYSANVNGSKIYCHGIKTGDKLTVSHITIEDEEGQQTTIIYNRDYYPIQWFTQEYSVAVRRLNGTFDAKKAFFSVIHEGEQDTLTRNINPNNLLSIVESIEEAEQITLKEAREFLATYPISFSEIVAKANLTGQDQIKHIIAACAFSFAAAAVDQEKNAGGKGSGRLTNLSKVFETAIQIGASMLGHIVAKELNYGLPTDSGGPIVRMLLCRGASKYIICHYHFFRYSGNSAPCLNFCQTTTRCFTDICMPIGMSWEEASKYGNEF